jgi:hypothetical protein
MVGFLRQTSILFLGLVGLVSASAAQTIPDTILPGEARQMAGRFAAANRLVAKEKWHDAMDEFQRLLDGAEDVLVPLDPQDPRHLVSLRLLCHARLVSLPEAALRVYRQRVDAKALRWLTDARQNRDIRLLNRLVAEVFCSSHTDKALELLGDLHFEKGQFAEAQHYWHLLEPALTEKATTTSPRPFLLFPRPKTDPARIQAKQLLARLFQGDVRGSRKLLERYRLRYPEVEGTFAGQRGRYVDVLQEFLDAAARDGPPGGAPDWATFGADASRNAIVEKAPDRRIWMDHPGWKVRLDRPQDRDDRAGATSVVISPTVAAGQLAFFPLIVEDWIIVSDACQVKAYDRESGRIAFSYDLQDELPGEKFSTLQRKLPAPQGLHYTLTAADDALFVRLGRQRLGPREGGGLDSYLVRLDLHPSRAKPGARRWIVKATTRPDKVCAFEGSPVVHDGLVYIAHSRFQGIHTQTAIVCYRAEDGVEMWRKDICTTSEFKTDSAPRYRHHHLTLAGSILVYCSHSGAMAAVEVGTGRRAWSIRYPVSAERATLDAPGGRDLGACLYHQHLIYVSPRDSNTLYCLDAESGQTLWSRDGLHPVHLLGVSDGRLLLTTRTGLRAIHSLTGDDRGAWAQPDEGALPALGRALVAGGWIFWPTHDAERPMRAVSVVDGGQERDGLTFDLVELQKLPPGNLAFAHDCLVVAGAEEMYVYARRR